MEKRWVFDYSNFNKSYEGQQRDFDQDFIVHPAYPILIPDAGVEIGEEALDSGESGRDEAGYMHIHNLRPSVKYWVLKYNNLCTADYMYMREVIQHVGTFQIYLRGEYDLNRWPCRPEDYTTYQVYCRKYGIALQNKKTGDWRNLSFKIIEC